MPTPPPPPRREVVVPASVSSQTLAAAGDAALRRAGRGPRRSGAAVDLPAPDGPSSASSSPGAQWNSHCQPGRAPPCRRRTRRPAAVPSAMPPLGLRPRRPLARRDGGEETPPAAAATSPACARPRRTPAPGRRSRPPPSCVSPGRLPPTMSTTPNSPSVWAKVSTSADEDTRPRERQLDHARRPPARSPQQAAASRIVGRDWPRSPLHRLDGEGQVGDQRGEHQPLEGEDELAARQALTKLPERRLRRQSPPACNSRAR